MRWANFRVWIDVEKKMYLASTIELVDCGKYKVTEVKTYCNSETEYDFDCEDCEIMQSTGLIDKNNVEIYEGDICKLYLAEGSKLFPDDDILTISKNGDYFVYCEIVKHPTFFSLKLFNSENFEDIDGNPEVDKNVSIEDLNWNYRSVFAPEYAQAIEVIGNIYENKELLK